MSVNVQLLLVGVCAYVPDKYPLNPKDPPTRFDVFMVDARRKDKKALDNRALRPHFPVVTLKTDDLAERPRVSGDVVWVVARRRLRFEFTEKTSDANELTVDLTPIGSTPTAQNERSFLWGVDLAEIAPKFKKVNAKCFNDRESENLVSCRLLVDKGHVTTFALDPKATFTFNTNLDGVFNKRGLSNYVSIEFKDVDAFTIVAEDLDGQQPTQRVPLRSAGPDFEIVVGNLCDGLFLRRLGGYTDAEVAALANGPDDDFRWLYEICGDTAGIKKKLGTNDLPIPVQKGKGGSGFWPVRCMRATFEPS